MQVIYSIDSNSSHPTHVTVSDSSGICQCDVTSNGNLESVVRTEQEQDYRSPIRR